MHRPYTRELFRDRVETVLAHMPDAAIGVDTLVGFPGESDQAFRNTHDLLEALPIMYLHVFPFSPRKKTPAYTFPDPIDPAVMKVRTDIMRELGAKKRYDFLNTMVGKKAVVLFENKRDRKTGNLKGLTSNYVTVLAEGPDTAYNTLETVLIESAGLQTVSGKLSF
jgi:threonylcarbamoyladenosine tRNA methylthiotransferase MtaB